MGRAMLEPCSYFETQGGIICRELGRGNLNKVVSRLAVCNVLNISVCVARVVASGNALPLQSVRRGRCIQQQPHQNRAPTYQYYSYQVVFAIIITIVLVMYVYHIHIQPQTHISIHIHKNNLECITYMVACDYMPFEGSGFLTVHLKDPFVDHASRLSHSRICG